MDHRGSFSYLPESSDFGSSLLGLGVSDSSFSKYWGYLQWTGYLVLEVGIFWG